MSTDVENILERRRLRRRLSFWRIAAVVLAGLGLLSLALPGDTNGPGLGRGSHVARISIDGMIFDDRDQLDLLKKAGDAANVAGVILAINSPGGTTTGGEALYGAIRDLAKKKPVVAVCGTIATSAAYMISLASDRIFVRGNTITGSVGVIFQFPEVSALLDKLGVKMYEIKSGALKANPSMFQPLDEGGKAVATEMVMESQSWFLGLVRERRGLDTKSVPGLEEGRIYSGRQALGYKLIDAVGGETEALAWLHAEKGLKEGLPVHDWKPKRDGAWSYLGGSSGALDRLFGSLGGDIARVILGSEAVDRVQLDGLLSLWHAQPN